MTDSPIRRAGRSLLQLIAAGGLTGIIAAIVGGLSPYWAGIILAANAVLVSFAQNTLEDANVISPVLGTKPSDTGQPSQPVPPMSDGPIQ